MSEINKRILSEEELNYCYEKAELDLLRDALKLSYSERFTMMMTLIKAGIMMSKAKTVHKPYLSKSS
jgi:hypothetical protein